MSDPYNFQAADEAAAIAVCKREKAAHQPTGGVMYGKMITLEEARELYPPPDKSSDD